ncbi:hypothetical protein ABT127_16795 [Streptomyces sp. NPDC001904]|uniref:hypothetical protein n=1 Tax=Streptomyces sp. NPDC001904 TaxID=3154531 RepID=UPI00331E371C
MTSSTAARTATVPPCHVAPGQADFAASPPTLFHTESCTRLPASLLPAELSDPHARRILAGTGLPSLSAAELTLHVDPRAPLPRVGDLPLFVLGDWNGGPIAVHASTGRIYRLPSHDSWSGAGLPDDTPPDPDRYGWTAQEWNVDRAAPHLMAENLDVFVRLVTAWAALGGHLPMAYTRGELLALRDELESHLLAISPHAAYSWWTEGLYEVL